MQNKYGSRSWSIAALVCCILPFFLSFFLFSSGFQVIYDIGFVTVALAISGAVLAVIALVVHKTEHEVIRKKGKKSWVVAVFICCILPFALPFSLPILGPTFGDAMFCVFLAAPPSIGLIALILAVTGLRKGFLRPKALAIIVFVPAGLEIAFGLLAVSVGRSCGPSLYSFDGKGYVFDSEPYAGAILIERTGYTKLNHLVPVDDKYQIKITNELDETHYTDELKLQVIDHPVGTEVVSDMNGRIHTITTPVIPISAYQIPGVDILDMVSMKDNKFWPAIKHNDMAEGIVVKQEELILEFPKPHDAKIAKLVINVSNTFWSTSVSSSILKYFGCWYPVMSTVRSYARQGFIRFGVQLWQSGKWITMGTIRGSNPDLPKDQLVTIDVSRNIEEFLKLRLTPRAGFWRINSVIVDYSDDAPCNVIELEATSAVNNKGEDIRGSLAANDNNFYTAGKGDYATITFNEPSRPANTTRSFILKASGHYMIGTTP